MLEDTLRIAPKSSSEFVYFELGLEYCAHLAWHLKERSAEEFGWTANTKGILEGVGSTIKPEIVDENDWEREPRVERLRHRAGKKIRRNLRRAVRGPENKSC